jgi:hypothetical protein
MITIQHPLQTQTLKVFSAKQYLEFAGNRCLKSIFDHKEDPSLHSGQAL